jgi:2-iminobutanoate/2-iminopropanoate deaminase
MKIQFDNPATIAAPDGQFSQCAIIRADCKMLYISGQVPRNATGDTVGAGDMTAQATQVFGNLLAILQAHGGDFSNAVKATIFVTDMQRAGEVIAVRKKFYGDAAPASTFVAVSALGDPDWWLEIEMVAAI